MLRERQQVLGEQVGMFQTEASAAGERQLALGEQVGMLRKEAVAAAETAAERDRVMTERVVDADAGP